MDSTFLRQRALDLWQEGQLYQGAGQLERAIRIYSKSIEIFPTAEAHTYRGWAYSHQQRWDEAIAECKKAIELDPGFGNPYNDIGSYLCAQGKIEEGIEWLEKAKKAPRYEPRHYPYVNLARIYSLKGMMVSAIRELEQATQISPEDPTAQALLTDLRRQLH